MSNFQAGDDIIDVRDIIARVEELREQRDSLKDDVENAMSQNRKKQNMLCQHGTKAKMLTNSQHWKASCPTCAAMAAMNDGKVTGIL